MVRIGFGLWLAATMALSPAAAASGASRLGPPPGATLSAERLARITDFFNAEVDGGRIPGAVVLVQRHGQPVYIRCFGKIDMRTGEPMSPQAIFRLHSMTKVVTSVAAMMLVDDGRLTLDAPLSRFIPAFAKAKVGVPGRSREGDPVLRLEPVRRPITIRDLLRHSSGITYGFYGESLVRRVYGAAQLFADDLDNASFAARIAQLPLAEQPGTLWDYGHSTDVLGRVIEIVSGKSLYAFEKERLFDPLGMTDTGYFVPDPAKHHLLAEPLPSDTDFRTATEHDPRRPTAWQSGGGGLLTTIGDFSRFAQMLLNRGTFGGRTFLHRKTFDTMVANHIAPATAVQRGEFYFPGDGFGFGLGFAVRIAPGVNHPPPPGSLGEIKWDGAGGTYFWVDFAQDMFAVLLIQTPSERGRIEATFKRLVYKAFE